MAEFRVHRVNFFNYVPVAIHNIAFDEKTDKLALSRANGSIEIYDARNGWLQEKIFPPCEDQSVEALLWCQGHLLSAGLHGNILQHDLLSLTTMKRTSSNSGAVWCMVANNDETQIAAGTEDGCVAIFNVTEEGVEYSRALDKQEGRILCIAWYTDEQGKNLIVTGGMDNIRIWSVNSGHAIQRLTLGRQQKNKATIVWTIAIAKNFTIVSGDSRGKTCFWDGKTGTPIKTFSIQETDILTIAVGKKGTEVYCAGVHPSVVMYQLLEGDRPSTWVRSVVDTRHTRDVRAIAVTSHGVVSGGVDCTLVFNTRTDKKNGLKWRNLPFIPIMTSLACAAKKANMLLLQYPEYLELWQLGKTSVDSDKNADILPLRQKPKKLVQLKSRGGTVVCSCINSQGTWIAYSDQETIRMFNLQIEEVEFEDPKLSINKMKVSGSDIFPAHRMKFTPNGKILISATCMGSLQLIDVTECPPVLVHTFYVQPEDASSIHLLSVSNDSKFFAVGDHKCRIIIYNIETRAYKASLPTYTHQPTALCFHPTTQEILVMYADRKLHEYNYSAGEYTAWSRKMNQNWHPNWLHQPNKITHLTYNLQDPMQIIMAHESMLCVLDKRKPLPPHDSPLLENETQHNKMQHKPRNHAFHFCNDYKLILHVEMLSDDYLLIVEKSPISILDQLPPALKQKKFGT